MKITSLMMVFLFLGPGLILGLNRDEAGTQEIEEFIADLKQSIENTDLNSFQQAFSSDIRSIEAQKFRNFIQDFSLSSVSVESVSINKKNSFQSRVYLIITFQNVYSIVFDTWQLDMAKIEGDWRILNKEVIGQTQTLYKLEIPSDRIERVKKFRVKHQDISFTFEDPVVFYDNAPGLETGMIVVGRGQVEFTPSLPREQHHLELMYKTRSLNSQIDSLYLRFSPDFFKKNIEIIKGALLEKPIYESDIHTAREIFERNYPRSFTVRSSLTQDFFSVLPKGDEVSFDFKVKRIGELTYIFSPFAFEEVHLYQWKKDKIICLYSPPVEEEGKKLFISFGQKFDLKNYQLDINYNPEHHHFSGKANIRFESNVRNLSSVKFKLNPNLKILRINDRDQNKLYFSQDDYRSTVYVYLLDRLSSGELGEIDIYYRGTVPPQKKAYEAIEALQREAQIEFVEKRDRTFFYSRSSNWYPAPSEEDYFTARLKLALPSGYSAVSNGVLIPNVPEERGEKRRAREGDLFSIHTFEVENQVKYLAFLAGRLLKEAEVKNPIPMDYYRAPRTQAYTKGVVETAADIVNFYQDRFGPYPFGKLSLVRQVGKNKGGASPPSFVVINDLPRMSGVVSRRMARSPVDLSGWKEYFMAHEIAHQWWGQGLSWESYHDQWISEGLAQFSSSLYLKKRYGEDAYEEILKDFSRWTKKNSQWGAIIMGSRISHLNFEAYQSVIYNKASLVLNMLKDLLGEDLFFLGLQRFFRRHVYRAADTKAFIRIFNELSEDDLELFFKGWFQTYHLPEVKVTHSIERNKSGFILRLSVIQNNRFFMFPLWLEWKENGEKVRKMVIVDRKVV
ncbi:MAG: hypothetical protein GF421_04260, partial [Candidatus Aminicenantes bacterium]|nr:hypothetical protein [Candidatus Aminicenantes bacterium]